MRVVAGIAIGLGVGWLIRQLRRRLDNPPLEITIALLSGYLAYIPAELADASAVLAAVTVGIYMGAHTSELTTAQTRVQGDAVWEIVVFLLNALLFVLIGLQLPVILDELSGEPAGTLLVYGADRVGDGHPRPHRRVYRDGVHPAVAQSADPRARPVPALAVPGIHLLGGHARRRVARRCARLPSDDRRRRAVPAAAISFCSSRSASILATLVGQGLTMPLVIRLLGLESDRTLGEGGDEGAHPSRRGRSRPAGGARRARTGCERTRPNACAASTRFAEPIRGPFRRRGRRRHRGAVGSPTSACAASCSTPSGGRSTSCGARASSPSRSCSASIRDLDLEDLRLDA